MSTLPVAAVAVLGMKAALIVGAAWLLSRVLAARSAAARHVVWAAALAALILLPAVTPLAPAVSLHVLPQAAAAPPTPSSSQAGDNKVIGEASALPSAVSQADRDRHIAANDRARAPWTSADRRAGDVASARAVIAAWPRLTAELIVTAAWIAGTLVYLLRFLHGLVTARRLVASGVLVDAPEWRQAMADACLGLGVKAIPPLVASPQVSVPITTGIGRPAVVLPIDALEWPDERRRIVLLHELAHVRRRDTLVQCLQHVTCALHWWNPAVWLAAARLALERERACDDLVLDAGLAGEDYAEHLVDIARQALGYRPLAAPAVAMARPSELEGRVMAILDNRTIRGRVTRRMLAGAAAGVLVSAGMMASVRLEPRLTAAVLPAGVVEAQTAAAAAPAAAPQTAEPGPAIARPQPRPQPAARPVAAAQAQTAPPEGLIGDIVDGVVEAAITGVQEGVPGGVRGGVPGGVGRRPGADAAKKAASGEEISEAVRESVTAALMSALDDKNPDVRKQALFALSGSPSPKLVDAMLTALRDADPDVRQQAAFALGRSDDARAVPALATALKDAEADVRQQAAFALGQIGNDTAITALTAAMSDKEPEVRAQVVFALGRIGGPKTVDALTKALSDPDDDVRAQAAFALGSMLKK